MCKRIKSCFWHKTATVCQLFVCDYLCLHQPKLRVRRNRMLMHSIALFSHFYVKIKKHAQILSDAVAEIMELGEAELLDSLVLINIVPGISVVVQSLVHF